MGIDGGLCDAFFECGLVIMGNRLSEGQLAVTADAMALVMRAESNLENTMYSLKNCNVQVDSETFKHIQFYLDQLHTNLSMTVLEHIDADGVKK